ncbi:hypothetical protein N8T08_008372 [Aspergillus melleus]|uniref:Uncharacterized protein n=1 Tax=Aspergillus melleus TaxID=138277 RepID=A0ACC3AVC1_9EURO|nr:hypothetical protein N8T08_008372 [Aspergillus melleus]
MPFRGFGRRGNDRGRDFHRRGRDEYRDRRREDRRLARHQSGSRSRSNQNDTEPAELDHVELSTLPGNSNPLQPQPLPPWGIIVARLENDILAHINGEETLPGNTPVPAQNAEMGSENKGSLRGKPLSSSGKTRVSTPSLPDVVEEAERNGEEVFSFVTQCMDRVRALVRSKFEDEQDSLRELGHSIANHGGGCNHSEPIPEERHCLLRKALLALDIVFGGEVILLDSLDRVLKFGDAGKRFGQASVELYDAWLDLVADTLDPPAQPFEFSQTAAPDHIASSSQEGTSNQGGTAAQGGPTQEGTPAEGGSGIQVVTTSHEGAASEGATACTSSQQASSGQQTASSEGPTQGAAYGQPAATSQYPTSGTQTTPGQFGSPEQNLVDGAAQSEPAVDPMETSQDDLENSKEGVATATHCPQPEPAPEQ